MSNSISNILTINGTDEQIAKVRETIKGSNGESISLQSIYPMPKNLKGKKMVEVKEWPVLEGGRPVAIPDWHYWRLKNWGVIWDAEPVSDDVVDSPNSIIFNTESDTPKMAMMILSLLFPEVTFHVTFSDEVADQYCGEYTLSGGKVTNEVCYDAFDSTQSDIPDDQVMEYYFRTHEYDRENWKKDEDGTWYNIEDEDFDEE